MIVCDTNVLISALVFPGGFPDKTFREVLSGRFLNATSPDLMTELRRVLDKKLRIAPERVEEAVSLVLRHSQLVYPTERLTVVQNDNADNRVIECAVTAKARFLVTGDSKHLLPLASHAGISIVSPADFARQHGVV